MVVCSEKVDKALSEWRDSIVKTHEIEDTGFFTDRGTCSWDPRDDEDLV